MSSQVIFDWWLSSKDMKLRVLIKEGLVVFHWLTFHIILLCSLASGHRALFLVEETTQELLYIYIYIYMYIVFFYFFVSFILTPFDVCFCVDFILLLANSICTQCFLQFGTFCIIGITENSVTWFCLQTDWLTSAWNAECRQNKIW